MTDRDREYRPRTTYENKRSVFDHARRINGARVEDFHTALELIFRYLDTVSGAVDTCPECGSADVETGEVEIERGEWLELAGARWWCHGCEGSFTAIDYVAPDDPEAAAWPGTRKQIQQYFSRSEGGPEARGTHGNQSGIEGLSR